MSKALGKAIIEKKKRFHKIRDREIVDYDDKGKAVYENWNDYYERVARNLTSMMLDDGAFYFSESTVYYFNKLDNTLYPIDQNPRTGSRFLEMLILHFNLSQADMKFTNIFSRFYHMASYLSEEASIYLYNHYDVEKNTIYVKANREEMWVIEPESVRKEFNGYKGVIFKDIEWYEDIDFDVDKIASTENTLSELFLDKIWFEESVTGYSGRLQRVLFHKWLLSCFFPTLVNQRPLLVIQGDTGTGKTSTLVNIGRILFGDNFAPTVMPPDQRDFINLLVNNHMLVIDNVDESMPDWFQDTLTAITTGGSVSYRPLYKDVNVPSVRVRTRTYTALSTRTGVFNRADVSNRSIILTLGKPQNESYDYSEYERQLIDKRSEIWLQVIYDLQYSLKLIAEQRMLEVPELRMSEFATFCINTTNEGEEMIEIHEALNMAREMQSEFTSQERPLVDAIRAIVDDMNSIKLTPDELINLLDDYGLEYKNAQHLGYALKKDVEAIKQFMKYKKGVTKGKTTYTFENKDGKAGEQQSLNSIF